MDISDILKCKCCTDIFPEDISLAQPLYMALMLKYHPDKCSDPRAAEAAAVINELYRKLKKAHVAQEKLFRCGSRAIEIKYLMELTQEYGMEYIGERNVYFLISNKAEQQLGLRLYLLFSSLLVASQLHHPQKLHPKFFLPFLFLDT